MARRGAVWQLLHELRTRKVCRTAISYMLVMWLNLQIGDVIFPMIGLPDWSLTLIIVIGVMGFPVVLILAWAFQVTPQGIVLDEGHVPESHTYWRLDALVNALLLTFSVVLSMLLLMQFFDEERSPLLALAPRDGSTAIVISNLSFEAASDAPINRTMAIRIFDELKHRLINLEGVDLMPDESQPSASDDRRRVSLIGSLLVEDSTAHVLAHLVDLSAGRYLMSITFNLRVESALVAEAAAAQRIVDELGKVLLADQTGEASAANR